MMGPSGSAGIGFPRGIMQTGEDNMSVRNLSIAVALLLLAAFAGGAAAQDQGYIVMRASRVNLRATPSTDGRLVTAAEKGDVFKLVSRDGDWFKVEMFGPAYRYVFAASYVHPLAGKELAAAQRMALPDSSAAHRAYLAVVAAREQAERKSAASAPEGAVAERLAFLRGIVEDRMILQAMHDHHLQPALYDDLMARAKAENW